MSINCYYLDFAKNEVHEVSEWMANLEFELRAPLKN